MLGRSLLFEPSFRRLLFFFISIEGESKLSANKSDKEMAFLQDLYVATDWGERFAELMDAHVELPKKGRILYVASGTGGHSVALQERAGDNAALVWVDESEE